MFKNYNKKINAPWVMEVIAERFDNALDMLTPDSMVYGGAVRDALAGISLDGDLDVCVNEKSANFICKRIKKNVRWKAEDSKKNKVEEMEQCYKNTKTGALDEITIEIDASEYAANTLIKEMSRHCNKNTESEIDSPEYVYVNENTFSEDTPVVDASEYVTDDTPVNANISDILSYNSGNGLLPNTKTEEVIRTEDSAPSNKVSDEELFGIEDIEVIVDNSKKTETAVDNNMWKAPTIIPEISSAIANKLVKAAKATRSNIKTRTDKSGHTYRTYGSYSNIISSVPTQKKPEYNFSKNITVNNFVNMLGLRIQIVKAGKRKNSFPTGSLQLNRSPYNYNSLVSYNTENCINNNNNIFKRIIANDPVFKIIRDCDLICCAVAMDINGNVFEFISGAYEDCRNKELNLNKDFINVNTDIGLLTERVKKLEARGWKSNINLDEVKNKVLKLVKGKNKRKRAKAQHMEDRKKKETKAIKKNSDLLTEDIKTWISDLDHQCEASLPNNEHNSAHYKYITEYPDKTNNHVENNLNSSYMIHNELTGGALETYLQDVAVKLENEIQNSGIINRSAKFRFEYTGIDGILVKLYNIHPNVTEHSIRKIYSVIPQLEMANYNQPPHELRRIPDELRGISNNIFASNTKPNEKTNEHSSTEFAESVGKAIAESLISPREKKKHKKIGEMKWRGC